MNGTMFRVVASTWNVWWIGCFVVLVERLIVPVLGTVGDLTGLTARQGTIVTTLGSCAVALISGVVSPAVDWTMKYVTLAVKKEHGPGFWIVIGLILGAILCVILFALISFSLSVMDEEKARRERKRRRKEDQEVPVPGANPVPVQATQGVVGDAHGRICLAGSARIELRTPLCYRCGRDMQIRSSQDGQPLLHWVCRANRAGSNHCPGKADAELCVTATIQQAPVAG
jgi:hypothetical protein